MKRHLQETAKYKLRWHEFVNDSGEEIPAGAILRLSSGTLDTSYTGSDALRMGKPNAVGSQGQHYVNGLNRVGIGKRGLCCFQSLCLALYDSSSGTPALGEAWGPNNGSWKLVKRIGGYKVVALPTNGQTAGLMVVRRAPWTYGYGVLDGDIAHGGSATVSVHDSSGDTTFNITVYDEDFIGSGKEIVSGSRVHYDWAELDERFILTGSNVCPTTA